MCGRYATTRSSGELLDAFDIRSSVTDLFRPADYNMAPTKTAPVRQLRELRWGLVPSWAKDPSIGSRMINARAETVATKPAFRRAFAARRALVPADGFYEWFPHPAARPRRQALLPASRRRLTTRPRRHLRVLARPQTARRR